MLNSGLAMFLKSMGVDPTEITTMVTELAEVVKIAAADLQTVKQQNAEIIALLKTRHENKETEHVG